MDVKLTDWIGLANSKKSDLFELIERLVLIESPSSDKASNDQLSAMTADLLQCLGAEVKIHPDQIFGNHLTADWAASRNATNEHALIVGHLDTVWPLGTLERVGYTQKNERIYGPGVLDMKAGIATTIIGLKTIQEEGLWPDRPIKILFNTDEEVGSPSSRSLVQQSAKGAAFALIMEPGQGKAGALKTERKGLAEFKISIEGKASHAGAFPEHGASAIHQLALTIIELQAMNDWDNGITVNSGLITGGSARNTIPATADAIIDVRVRTNEQAKMIESRIQNLETTIEGTKLTIEGGFHRPPMERTRELAELAEKLIKWSHKFGFELTEQSTGGGSDANLTAAMGVPSVDGMGAKGLNPHAEGENIEISAQVNRLALFMKAINSL
ncbi:MAG: M20 family metallopeptidase [SAR202 cluster bacterium]|nr:hypothetical protein [Chloroflexota bacterium]MQG88421.1 M20 family metallopeptidase [SAR202 cluster bacterium]|tara:strand:+ start:4140 stop:5294 length:1155 start_codon:yes stop_codon:yes gene_type:complete